MQLAVGKFFNYKPAAQWAFDIQFSDLYLMSRKTYAYTAVDAFSDADLQRISQSVVSVTMPKFKIEQDTKCYGNFDFVIPKYDANDYRLTITFEDTDDCLISYKLISALMGTLPNSSQKVPAWLNVHPGIFITVNKYNPYQHDELHVKAIKNGNSVCIPNDNAIENGITASTNNTTYFCKMVEYTEPTYSRMSDSPSATTVQITFLVVPNAIRLNDNSVVDYSALTDFEDISWDTIIAKLEALKIATVELAANAYGKVVNAVGTGLMGGETLDVKLSDLVKDAAAKGYDLSSLQSAAEYISANCLAGTPQEHCTRAVSLMLQLFSYANDKAGEVVDKYISSGHADNFGFGDNDNITEATKSLYTETKYDGDTINNSNLMSNIIAEHLKNEGDYVTFHYVDNVTKRESYHIVFKGVGGKYYSDFTQGTAAGIAQMDSTYSNIRFYNTK